MGDFTKPRRYIGVFPDGMIAIFADAGDAIYCAYNPEEWQPSGFAIYAFKRKYWREKFGVKFIDKYEGKI